ncbi:MAG TPA: tRNA (adenosine(37)-N6)-threonylcarbamoyltransferase complex ATPase subunit type 1 TsaE [Polyangiaceae bacterium]
MTEFALPTRRATQQLARRLAPLLAPGDLLILDGPLGSGKTFFTRALCRALGLPASQRVPSPTFTLVHEHATEPPVAHADLYRLTGLEQVRQLGLDAQRDEGRLLVVEWGEPYIELLGGDALILRLSLDPRSARFSATGPRSARVLAALSA